MLSSYVSADWWALITCQQTNQKKSAKVPKVPKKGKCVISINHGVYSRIAVFIVTWKLRVHNNHHSISKNKNKTEWTKNMTRVDNGTIIDCRRRRRRRRRRPSFFSFLIEKSRRLLFEYDVIDASLVGFAKNIEMDSRCHGYRTWIRAGSFIQKQIWNFIVRRQTHPSRHPTASGRLRNKSAAAGTKIKQNGAVV